MRESVSCLLCGGSGEVRCPFCDGDGMDGGVPCHGCTHSGVIRCTRCNGTGEEPPEQERTGEDPAATEPRKPPPLEIVDLPWGRARIVELVNVALPHHHPSIELLADETGRLSLRFAAFHEGRPVEGPLVLGEDDLVHVARAARGSPRIHAMLGVLAGRSDSGWPTPDDDVPVDADG